MKKKLCLTILVAVFAAVLATSAAAESDRSGETAPPAASASESDIRTAEVGDILCFGAFEQDNDAANGKESIEWIVLEKEDDRLFVISKYALFAMGYHHENAVTTWETCTLRAWLNGEFLDEAFSAGEQARILTVAVPPAESPKYHTDPGNATEDKLFLISIADLNQYFPTDSDRECQPTAYACANGAQANESNGNCWWWLRSPGIAQNCAARVNCYGSLRNSGPPVSSYYSCVRPAMWIETGS